MRAEERGWLGSGLPSTPPAVNASSARPQRLAEKHPAGGDAITPALRSAPLARQPQPPGRRRAQNVDMPTPTKDIIAFIAWLSAIHGYVTAAFIWYAAEGRLQVFQREFTDAGAMSAFACYAAIPALPVFLCGVFLRSRIQRPLVVLAITAATGSALGGAIFRCIITAYV